MNVRVLAAASCLVFLLLGCAKRPWSEVRDPVSAGTAKLLLKKGETSQTEVIEAFGGPNVVTGDADGNEVWTYDRMAYVHSEFSGGGVGGAGGLAGTVPVGGLVWGNAAKGSSGSRTVTLFLYWKQGVLTNYKYRSATF